jgi:L-methionine (R)-S-oxide reductase
MKAPNLFGVPGDAGDMLDDLADRPRLTPWSVEGLVIEAAQPQRVQLAQPAQPVAGLVQIGLGEWRPVAGQGHRAAVPGVGDRLGPDKQGLQLGEMVDQMVGDAADRLLWSEHRPARDVVGGLTHPRAAVPGVPGRGQKLAGPVGVVLTRVAVMDWSTVLRAIDEVLASQLGRADKAARVAALIREAGRYRWVGLYAVADQAITVIGWSGPGAPAHPRFPVTQGLSGAAVATKRALVVNDVTADPRYLTAFASTLSEAIVPILDPGTGTVVGTLDAESGERDAFTDADRLALEGCAAALANLIAEARS